MTQILNLAIDYLDHGFTVIPSLRESKRPPFAWKEFQTRKTTQEEASVWWTSHPEWNIALVCGATSGLIVVDADDDESTRFCKVHLDPTPFRVQTAKGMHFYYQHPGGRIQSKARIHPTLAVDVRADGGLATGIGSTHKTGFVYRLDTDCDMASPLTLPRYNPEWFPLARPPISLPRVTASGSSLERATRYMAVIPGTGSGIRNQSAYRLAVVLTRDFALDIDTSFALLWGWNEKNDPPLPRDELLAIVKSSLVSGSFPIGNKVNPFQTPP